MPHLHTPSAERTYGDDEEFSTCTLCDKRISIWGVFDEDRGMVWTKVWK